MFAKKYIVPISIIFLSMSSYAKEGLFQTVKKAVERKAFSRTRLP